MSPTDARTRAVIFDLDGVLVDSEALHVEAWREVFTARGVIVSDEEYAHGVGMADADWLAWLAPRRAPPLAVQECLDAKLARVQEALARKRAESPAGLADRIASAPFSRRTQEQLLRETEESGIP